MTDRTITECIICKAPIFNEKGYRLDKRKRANTIIKAYPSGYKFYSVCSKKCEYYLKEMLDR